MTGVLRLVLAGVGAIAPAWLDAIARVDGVELVAAVDPRRELARSTLDAHGAARIPLFPDLAAALVAQPHAMANLTPPAAHSAIIAAAFDAGLDVVTEKPLAPGFRAARDLVARATASGRRLVVMQNRRHSPAMRTLRDGIASGRLGRLAALSSDMWMATRHENSYLDSLPHPLLQDTAIHTFDQARFLTGSEARRLVAREYHPDGAWYRAGGGLSCLVEFDDGTAFDYRGNWVSPGFATSYDSSWRVTGRLGTALWDGWEASPRFQPATADGWDHEQRRDAVRWPVTGSEPGHVGGLREFVAAIRSGRPSETEGDRNLGTVAMVDAAMRSVEEERWVTLDEVTDGEPLAESVPASGRAES